MNSHNTSTTFATKNNIDHGNVNVYSPVIINIIHHIVEIVTTITQHDIMVSVVWLKNNTFINHNCDLLWRKAWEQVASDN